MFDLHTNVGNTKSSRVKQQHDNMGHSVMLPCDLLGRVGKCDRTEQSWVWHLGFFPCTLNTTSHYSLAALWGMNAANCLV